MPTDRTAALRNAEALLRQGRANDALDEFVQIADELKAEGFLPASSAVYKKILRIDPAHEHALVQLAEVSAAQGLLSDARQAWLEVARNRNAKGDRHAVADITIHLATLDPTDVEARLAAIRARLETAGVEAARADCQVFVTELIEAGRWTEVGQVVEAVMSLNVVVDDPRLLLTLAESRLRTGQTGAGLMLVTRVLVTSPAERSQVVALALALSDDPVPEGPGGDVGFAVASCAVDAAVVNGAFADAADTLERFVARAEGHVPALRRLIDVSVRGSLRDSSRRARSLLLDVLLRQGAGADARGLAEALVTEEPWESAHVERLRRALVLAGERDPDAIIASRLGGDEPFAAVDVSAPPQEAEVSAVAPAVEEDTQPKDLDAVFAEMRSRPAARDTKAETLYNGALALLEAGEVEEALIALESAARSPRMRFAASARAARVHRDRGDDARAVEWFERAVGTPPPTPEEGWLATYELAGLLESVSESDRALALYLELQSQAGRFRDVSARIDRLMTSGGGRR